MFDKLLDQEKEGLRASTAAICVTCFLLFSFNTEENVRHHRDIHTNSDIVKSGYDPQEPLYIKLLF